VRKFTIFLLVFFVVVLVVGLAWSMAVHTLASPFTVISGRVLFSQSTLGSSSGDSYYEERCIDVSQYYSQGYSNSGTDVKGCQLVSKTLHTAVMYCGCYCGTSPSGLGRCGVPYSNAGIICQRNLGSYYTGDYSSSEIFECYIPQVDSKGGFERVLNYCTYAQNDLLVAESFAGGQSIDKFSLRYPMKSFCRGHPSIVTDDALKQSVTSTNIPQDLIDGKSVSIGSGQTLTVFYIIENNANLPTICSPDSNLALDVSNPAVCKSTLGFTYLCSEGQFDALSGTCVVQPESKTLCSEGRYDVNSGLCIFNPPLQVDCGANNCFYSVDRNVCSCSVKDEFVCDLGFSLFEPSQSECVALGGSWQSCPQCPVDKICSTDICEPRCDSGQKCVYANPLVHDCEKANASIIKGQCIIDGRTLTLCPPSTTYNSDTELCQFTPDVVQVCPNGSSIVKNSLTQVDECIANPVSFIDCGNDEVFSNGKCLKQITVYVPQNDSVIIYQQINRNCRSDSDCNTSSTLGLTCNKANGYCQSPIYYKTNYTPVYISVGVAGLSLMFIFRKKKGKRK
jgi:hypothetical protein